MGTTSPGVQRGPPSDTPPRALRRASWELRVPACTAGPVVPSRVETWGRWTASFGLQSGRLRAAAPAPQCAGGGRRALGPARRAVSPGCSRPRALSPAFRAALLPCPRGGRPRLGRRLCVRDKGREWASGAPCRAFVTAVTGDLHFPAKCGRKRPPRGQPGRGTQKLAELEGGGQGHCASGILVCLGVHDAGTARGGSHGCHL